MELSLSTSSPILLIRKRTRIRPVPKIFRQMQGSVNAIVVGAGSGGTQTGIGRFMAKNSHVVELDLKLLSKFLLNLIFVIGCMTKGCA